jgi:hypothetical protein
VQGGRISYSLDQWDGASSAIANFWANATDPKASIYNTYNYISGVVRQLLLFSAYYSASDLRVAFQAEISTILFYDAPTCPEGMFDEFLSVPHIEKDISTRSYVSLVQSLPLNVTSGLRYVTVEDVVVCFAHLKIGPCSIG